MKIEGDILTVTVERNPSGGGSNSNAVWRMGKDKTRDPDYQSGAKEGNDTSPAAGTIPTTAPTSLPGLLPRGEHQHKLFLFLN